MLTLCLDTSGGSSVALVGETVLAAATSPDPRRHAETLAPMVDQVLAQAGASRQDVAAVAVGTGPAPFTGLRVGLVTARTLARALGVPVRGVSSLDALARQALDVAGVDDVVVVTDARRKEVYWARYRPLGRDDVERVSGPHVSAPAQVTAELDAGGSRPALAGPAAALCPAPAAPAHGAPDPAEPPEGAQLQAAVLARLVRSRLTRQEQGAAVELGTDPQYLRRPDVQAPGAPKRASSRG